MENGVFWHFGCSLECRILCLATLELAIKSSLETFYHLRSQSNKLLLADDSQIWVVKERDWGNGFDKTKFLGQFLSFESDSLNDFHSLHPSVRCYTISFHSAQWNISKKVTQDAHWKAIYVEGIAIKACMRILGCDNRGDSDCPLRNSHFSLLCTFSWKKESFLYCQPVLFFFHFACLRKEERNSRSSPKAQEIKANNRKELQVPLTK